MPIFFFVVHNVRRFTTPPSQHLRTGSTTVKEVPATEESFFGFLRHTTTQLPLSHFRLITDFSPLPLSLSLSLSLTHTHTHTHARTHTHTHTHACMHACMLSHPHSHTLTHPHTHFICTFFLSFSPSSFFILSNILSLRSFSITCILLSQIFSIFSLPFSLSLHSFSILTLAFSLYINSLPVLYPLFVSFSLSFLSIISPNLSYSQISPSSLHALTRSLCAFFLLCPLLTSLSLNCLLSSLHSFYSSISVRSPLSLSIFLYLFLSLLFYFTLPFSLPHSPAIPSHNFPHNSLSLSIRFYFFQLPPADNALSISNRNFLISRLQLFCISFFQFAHIFYFQPFISTIISLSFSLCSNAYSHMCKNFHFRAAISKS